MRELMLVALNDGCIEMFNLNLPLDRKVIVNGHYSEVSSIAISGGYLMSCAFGNHLIKWDVTTGKNLDSVTIADPGVVSHNTYLMKHDQTFSFQVTQQYENKLSVSPVEMNQERHVAVSLKGSVVSIKNTNDLKHTLNNLVMFEQGEICNLKYSPDGRFLAVVTTDGFILIYDSEDEDYALHGKCQTVMSPTILLDWNKKSDIIRTVSKQLV